MAVDQSEWQPDWRVPPGEILAEALRDRGMSQSDLARRMDRPTKTINEIVNGKAAITPDTAIQLERALGISARLWNGLEVQYRERLAYERADEELQNYSKWAADFPIRELVRQRLIPDEKSDVGMTGALLRYFGVSSPSAWERQWLTPAASFRKSPAFTSSPKAVAAWLRWGELQAATIEAAPFDLQGFKHVVQQVRELTRREPFLQVVERVRELCAAAGVVLVLTPELPGTRLSGAVSWVSGDKVVIQLSLRHKSDDQLWFSFFHEAGHIVRGKRQTYVDGFDQGKVADGEEEAAADSFARDVIVPHRDYVDFTSKGDFTESSVRAFAKEQGIAAGLVVGRLQRDRLVDRGHLNGLKRSLHWPKTPS